MQNKHVNITVNQHINYEVQPNSDKWELETTGKLIELDTFSRITYTDNDDVQISVKWQQERVSKQLVVEIKQPGYSLYFHPDKITRTPYHTPQGIWQLDVETKRIHAVNENGRSELTVNYQIKVDDEPLGDYQFQLIYSE